MLVFGLGTDLPGFAVSSKAQATEVDTEIRVGDRPKFAFCQSQCQSADYYTGYNRSNRAKLGNQTVATPEFADRLFPGLASLNLRQNWPNLDEKNIDNRDGNFVNSIHRIDHLRIGFLEKTELMQINALQDDASAKASVRLLWGDTISITSDHLPMGTPVTIQLKREMGGFGNPLTDYAHYQVRSTTYINRAAIPDLSFSLAKATPPKVEPELAQAKAIIPQVEEEKLGEGEWVYSFQAKVGETFTLEALLEVTDGVEGTRLAPQVLNGGDSVQYQIVLDKHSATQACLSSASRIFKSGQCDGLAVQKAR